MTPDQMAELAARLRELASLYRTFNQTGRDRSADLDRAADLIAGMAQRVLDEPVAFRDPETGDFSRVCRVGWQPLYLYPQTPSDAQRVSLSDDPTPEFVEWVRYNIPAGTVISDPDWWIPLLWRAVRNSTTDRQEDAA